MKLLLVLLVLIPGFAFAQSKLEMPNLVKASAGMAYVPGGFDNNDRVQLMVEGFYGDTCQRVGPYKKVIEPGRITIYLSAYRYTRGCDDLVVPFSQEIELGIVPEGRYNVVDGSTGKVIGQLPVKVSQHVEADDFFYAPVTDVNIAYGTAYNGIAVSGVFTDSCVKVKEVKAVVDGLRVVTVLPIAEKSGSNCRKGMFPYRKFVAFPAGVNGRNLLHVRSLSGQALNKLVDL